jgi:hypothetical protein
MATALTTWPDDRRLSPLAGLFCLGEITTWLLFVTARVPGFPGTLEPVEAIAVVAKTTELLAVLLALSIALDTPSYDVRAAGARLRPS